MNTTSTRNISAHRCGPKFEISFTLVHNGVEHGIKGDSSDFEALFRALSVQVQKFCGDNNVATVLADLKSRLMIKLGLKKPGKHHHFGPC